MRTQTHDYSLQHMTNLKSYKYLLILSARYCPLLEWILTRAFLRCRCNSTTAISHPGQPGQVVFSVYCIGPHRHNCAMDHNHKSIDCPAWEHYRNFWACVQPRKGLALGECPVWVENIRPLIFTPIILRYFRNMCFMLLDRTTKQRLIFIHTWKLFLLYLCFVFWRLDQNIINLWPSVTHISTKILLHSLVTLFCPTLTLDNNFTALKKSAIYCAQRPFGALE